MQHFKKMDFTDSLTRYQTVQRSLLGNLVADTTPFVYLKNWSIERNNEEYI